MAENKKAGLLHASERDGVAYKKATIAQLILGNANSGTGVIFYLVLGFASMIAPQGYGIPTLLTGTILMVTRMADGVSDMVVSAIFERINPKKGKIRIMILLGWAIAALAMITMYNWAAGKFEGIMGIVMFVVLYILFDIGNTINGVAGGTVGIVLTNDPTQRPMMGLISTVYSYCTPLIFTNLITFVILPKYDMQYNVPMLGELMFWMAAGAFVFVLIACWGVKDVDNAETFARLPKEEKEEEEKVSLKDMWSVLKDNRNVQMYMLAGISDKLAQQTMSTGIVTTLMAGVLIQSYESQTMVGNVSQIVGIAFAFCGGVFIAKWGARKAEIVWSWISILIAVTIVAMCLIICMTSGGLNGMTKFGVMGLPLILLTILTLGKTGASMILTTISSSMRADIVDYECERSGNYFPAVVAGVYSLIDKIVSSFASLVATGTIALIGYTTTVPQQGDTPTWAIFWAAMFLNFGLPILGWICNIIAMKFYTLDKERMIEVQKNLNARKEAAGIKAEQN